MVLDNSMMLFQLPGGRGDEGMMKDYMNYKMIPRGRGTVIAVDGYRMFIQSKWLTVDVVNKLLFSPLCLPQQPPE